MAIDGAKNSFEARCDVRAKSRTGRSISRFDCEYEHTSGKLASCLGEMESVDQPQVVSTGRNAGGQVGAGPVEQSDRPGLTGRRGRIDDDRQLLPCQTLQELDPAPDLVRGDVVLTAQSSRSMAIQPNWSSPCGCRVPRSRSGFHDLQLQGMGRATDASAMVADDLLATPGGLVLGETQHVRGEANEVLLHLPLVLAGGGDDQRT